MTPAGTPDTASAMARPSRCGLAQGAFICLRSVPGDPGGDRILAEPIDHSIEAWIVMCIAIAAPRPILYQRNVVAGPGRWR